MHVEAFIRWTILPGVYVGKMALDNGSVGAIPKSMLMDKVNTLLRLLSQPMPAAAPAGGPMPAAAPGAGAPQAVYHAAGGCSPAYARAGSADPCRAPHAGRVSGSAGSICGGARLHGRAGSGGGAQPHRKGDHGLGVRPAERPGGGGLPGGHRVLHPGNHKDTRTGMKSTAKGMAVAGLVLSILFLVVSLVECAAMILRFWLSLI